MKDQLHELIYRYTRKIDWFEENEPDSIVAEGWKLGLKTAINDLSEIIG